MFCVEQGNSGVLLPNKASHSSQKGPIYPLPPPLVETIIFPLKQITSLGCDVTICYKSIALYTKDCYRNETLLTNISLIFLLLTVNDNISGIKTIVSNEHI